MILSSLARRINVIQLTDAHSFVGPERSIMKVNQGRFNRAREEMATRPHPSLLPEGEGDYALTPALSQRARETRGRLT
jgi:hypothetical protein